MREVLIELLEERNITEYKLSKMTGISTGTLSDFRTGKTKALSFENFEKIADALDISLDLFRTKKKNKLS